MKLKITYHHELGVGHNRLRLQPVGDRLTWSPDWNVIATTAAAAPIQKRGRPNAHLRDDARSGP